MGPQMQSGVKINEQRLRTPLPNSRSQRVTQPSTQKGHRRNSGHYSLEVADAEFDTVFPRLKVRQMKESEGDIATK